jgi:transposase
MKDIEMKKQFVVLRAKGVSFSKIAEKLKVSKVTLIDWSKYLEKEILNLKAIEMEELQQMYYVQKQQRIEQYGIQLKQIAKELERRDLSDMPTDKLLELKLKYLDYLKREEIELSFQVEEQKNLDDIFVDMDKSIKILKV